jgi:hypothetical protein
VLLNRLNFFRLKDAFWKALENGSNFYTVSAGSDILCEKIVLHGLYNLDDSTPKMEFEFFDNGFGIISKITVFPHCHDRIRQDDPESLSYLAHRFKSHLCIGLDQHSFLKLETYLDKEGKIYERFVSAGKNEGVYVFDKSGRVIIKNYNEELEIPGTELYEKKHL